MNHRAFGKTELTIPPIIFGTSTLGNLFQVVPEETKLTIISQMFEHVEKPVVIDSAGKYGAGLSLEVLGRCLNELGISDDEVLISNKLGWLRAPLTTPEPTFEPGAWFGLEHDAVQDISYDGVYHCWEQGLELLGGSYTTQIVSVHDPDEYLASATSESDRKKRFDDILGAFRALTELKQKGHAKAVGVGAKDWTSIKEMSEHVELDWVMFANSYTLYDHPEDLLQFMDELTQKQIAVINSAVFNAGFLTGGEFFNYRKLDPNIAEDQEKFAWREKFFALCEEHDINAADVCVRFGRSHPGIVALAMSSSKPHRVKENVAAASREIPHEFWIALKNEGLIEYFPTKVNV